MLTAALFATLEDRPLRNLLKASKTSAIVSELRLPALDQGWKVRQSMTRVSRSPTPTARTASRIRVEIRNLGAVSLKRSKMLCWHLALGTLLNCALSQSLKTAQRAMIAGGSMLLTISVLIGRGSCRTPNTCVEEHDHETVPRINHRCSRSSRPMSIKDASPTGSY
jgi:hypothetical protein